MESSADATKFDSSIEESAVHSKRDKTSLCEAIRKPGRYGEVAPD